ncbi:hypothetical protein AMATHDRAFT_74779 [Amanita thiersii Skay4041]|uniref:Zn(2)-C6 fungal-type domain-containing protein n=1 Tax=Amanita thiersii Skay4041 TaxID=703135 RepID=A0A2A9NMH2_9AGAR|nr:hypothetical protein AMATHDRAFT_74779 [Amanita thiersii Skay4041]
MTSPPSGEPGSPTSGRPQPLPHQPQPTQTKPSSSGNKKGRQRKPAAEAKQTPTSSAAASVPVYASRGAILQPYPPPPFHIMNPSYPINGSPFPQQHHHPNYPPQASPPLNPNPPPIPPHHTHQYAYPVHPAPYAPPHPYTHYPQYPQPMVMYAPPRPSVPPDTPQSVPSPSLASPSASGQKRKRRTGPEGSRKTGEKASDDEAGASGSDINRAQQPPPQQQQQPIVDVKKRTKTQRACDSCRSRKIRCDILPDSDPPRCQHCKQYGFECTFFLPITETRFKKKKVEEEQSAAEKEKVAESTRAAAPQRPDTTNKQDIGVYGPTSATHLLHSQASISSRIYENYDLRYHHTFEVSQNGDGLIQVQKPGNEERQLTHPKPIDLRIEPEIVEQLVNAYFAEVAPLLPVVTRSEFLATPNPPPILLYSICLVAAARREVPQSIFDSIRFAVNSIIKSEDVLSTASIANVQSLLILCMTGDCHSQFVSSALSALWIRLGSAIRMAQDLGFHRAESVKHNIELRRRLWGACLISDRWTSLTYGHPYMIDVQDCDARLPSSGDFSDLYMDELVRLSVILGRVLKTIYSPSGLTFTTDEMLYQLLADIEAWKMGLPEHLKFQGPSTPLNAGLLHLLYACVCMMFWRVFMRISYFCPAHLKFGLTVEKWSSLVELTGEAIDWLDAHEKAYDVWLLVAYAATSCALVQYHTWARRKDNDAAAKLRKLRDCVRRWEGSISPDHMSARRKTAEIIALLYEATQGPHLPMEAPPLNPTGGVTARQPVGLEYKKDPTRPGGGVFIARGDAKHREDDFKDLPEGTIISGSSDDESGDVTAPGGGMSSVPPISDERGRDDRERASMMASSAFAPPLSQASDVGNVGGTGPEVANMRSGGGLLQSAIRNTLQGQVGGDGTGPSSMVNFTPLSAAPGAAAGMRRGATLANVNPAMNMRMATGSGQVQVMNVLDGQMTGGTLADFANLDTGFLEGIPGSMFDWGQWDNFFARFNTAATGGEATATVANMPMFQQQQQQQAQMQQRPPT